MVQDVVIGTLATLNLLVSPLSPGALSRQTYYFDADSTSTIDDTCTADSKLEHSRIATQVEGITEDYFILEIRARLCAAAYGTRQVTLNVNLPIQILDDTFWEKLKPGQSYIVRGMPSSVRPGKKDNIKLTRLTDDGSLMGLQIESLPGYSDGQTRDPEVHPIVIWTDRSNHAFADVPGFSKRALHWKRLQVNFKTGSTPGDFLMSGELKRIDDPTISKKR